MMDRNFVINHDLVRSYLCGELEEETSAAFEAFFLDDQDTLDELEIMSSFIESPNNVSCGSAINRASNHCEEIRIEGQNPSISEPTKLRLPTFLATAAILTVAIIVGLLLRGKDVSGPVSGKVALIDIAAVRSLGPPDVAVSEDSIYTVFRVNIGLSEEIVDVVLMRENEVIANLTKLSTDDFGDAIFVVPTANLVAGNHEFSAYFTDSNEAIFKTQVNVKL